MSLILAIAIVSQGPGYGGVDFRPGFRPANPAAPHDAGPARAPAILPDPEAERARWLATRRGAKPPPTPPPPPPPPPAERDDLELTSAVEEWVGVADTAGATPPAPYKGLIEALGRSDYRGREAASRALEAMLTADPAASRWLFRGRRHPDREVRLRANAILRRLNPCGACRGSGRSRGWAEWPCAECRGAKTRWPHSSL